MKRRPLRPKGGFRFRRPRLRQTSLPSYDYVTVGDDGTILAGTVERGVTYSWRPEPAWRQDEYGNWNR